VRQAFDPLRGRSSDLASTTAVMNASHAHPEVWITKRQQLLWHLENMGDA
jgi:hypothetical protein